MADAGSQLIDLTRDLSRRVGALRFEPPTTHVYNPLDYAWESHQLYLTKYADSTKKVIMLGMNPGGFVPFLPF